MKIIFEKEEGGRQQVKKVFLGVDVKADHHFPEWISFFHITISTHPVFLSSIRHPYHPYLDIFWEDCSRLCEDGKTKTGPQCGNGSIICLERAVRQRCICFAIPGF